MRIVAPVALVIAGYLAIAAMQDGALQVWLLILSPLALAGIALVLDIAERPKKN